MLANWFLGFNAVAFIGYGMLCLFRPEVVASSTGMVLPVGTAMAEVRAMYGGLQTGIGALALLGLRREHLRLHALVGLMFVYLGLATGRGYALLVEASPGGYNWAAFVFEAGSAALAVYLLRGREV